MNEDARLRGGGAPAVGRGLSLVHETEEVRVA